MRALPACLAVWLQLFYYGADWYGTWCYGGSSSSSSDTYYLYEKGTQMANVGYLLMAAVAIASSFVVTGTMPPPSRPPRPRRSAVLTLCACAM